jgi:antitoxin HicB
VLAYPVEFEPDDNDTVIATVPDVPGVFTYGDNEGEALRHVTGALLAMLSSRIDDRQDIPAPSAPNGRRTVRLPLQAELKVLLYLAMRDQRVTQVDLAQRMGSDPKGIRRLLDLTHASRLDQVEAALAALGKRVEIGLSNAA